jgi:phosphocarrier protein
MLQKEIKMPDRTGLNMNLASALVQTASRFRSQIHIEQGPRVINAKSLMGVLSIGSNPVPSLTFTVNGEDEKAALSALERLVRSWG